MEEKSEDKGFSLEEFKDFFEALYGKISVPPTQRELVVWTGQAGMELIDWQLRIAAMDNLLDHSTFSEEERIRIREMIYSEDRENFTIANALITETLNKRR